MGSADVNRDVASCCTGSYCMQPSDNADSFCMSFTIAEGLPCGQTQAEGYRGWCDSSAGLNCLNGVCSSAPTTTTTTTTTTTPPTTTGPTTTTVCIASGETCFDGSSPPQPCCSGQCPTSTGTCT